MESFGLHEALPHFFTVVYHNKTYIQKMMIHLLIKSKGFSLQGSRGDCEYAGSQLFENRRPSPSRNSNMQRVSRVSGQMPTHLLGLSSFYNSYYYLSIVKFLLLLLLLVYMSSFYNCYFYVSTVQLLPLLLLLDYLSSFYHCYLLLLVQLLHHTSIFTTTRKLLFLPLLRLVPLPLLSQLLNVYYN